MKIWIVNFLPNQKTSGVLANNTISQSRHFYQNTRSDFHGRLAFLGQFIEYWNLKNLVFVCMMLVFVKWCLNVVCCPLQVSLVFVGDSQTRMCRLVQLLYLLFKRFILQNQFICLTFYISKNCDVSSVQNLDFVLYMKILKH